VADAGLDSVDRELEGLGKTMRVNFATNPATAMRGSLPSSHSNVEQGEAKEEMARYVSPEMQTYLAPSAADPACAETGVRADAGFEHVTPSTGEWR